MTLDEALKAYAVAKERCSNIDGWWFWENELASPADALVAAQQARISELEAALEPFDAAYRLFFVASDRDDKMLYWFENTVRTGKQHPNLTLFVEDFRRAHDVYAARQQAEDAAADGENSEEVGR